MEYNKAVTNIEEQIQLLKSRGMEIKKESLSAHWLQQINNYNHY